MSDSLRSDPGHIDAIDSAVDLAGLLAAGTPFLDVRAPAEFAHGSVPGAVNVPLLDDAERHRVGLTYKRDGEEAAVALGYRLVSGETRERREQWWLAFAEAHPDGWIYCWRGGRRSQLAQAWLRALGVPLPRVPGGFKALRHTCLDTLDRAPRHKHWIVLGGRTGSGKTDLLRTLANAIDLEGLANHRGSAFGAQDEPQPTPVSFDNALAVAYLQHRGERLVVEDESRTIGRLALPQRWHEHMQTAPLALLDTPLEQRLANITYEYVNEPLGRGVPESTLYARYSDALRRIERRLGGLRRQAVQQALDLGFAHGDHGPWVEQLLTWYYDPMYDHQLQTKRTRIVAHGCRDELSAYLSE
ncbi:MAG: tRNA 2-selenouridine(34) synthase MnmH [Pseudomonadales bacterium]